MIRAYRLYSVVNIVGLSLGLACTIVITKYIHRELSVDHFLRDHDRICTLAEMQPGKEANLTLLPSAVRENFSGTEAFTETYFAPDFDLIYNGRAVTCHIWGADSSFFRIFDFPLTAGDPATVLASDDRVILSEGLARKVFGAEDPLGKSVMLFDKSATVAGIFRKPAGKGSIRFDAIASLSLTNGLSHGQRGAFYKMYPHADRQALAGRIPRQEGDQTVRRFLSLGEFYNTPLSGLGDMKRTGNPGSLRILGAVAFIVLLIGIFNFVNIYTVILLRRGREIGVRRVFGSGPGAILGQLVAENACMVVIAVAVAFAVSGLASEAVGGWLGLETASPLSFDVLLMLALMIVVPAVTVVYPYLKYRFAPPITSLRDVRAGGGSFAGRAVFLMAQYVMTFVLIVVSVFFVRQLHGMLNADLGYHTENVVEVSFLATQTYAGFDDPEQWEKVTNRVDRIAEELDRSPLVRDWSSCNSPVRWGDGLNCYPMGFGSEKTGEGFKTMSLASGNEHFTRVYGFELLEGGFLADSLHGWSRVRRQGGTVGVLLNRKARQELGVNVGDLIRSDKQIVYTSTPREDYRTFRVEGIVRDFAFRHLSGEIPPVVLYSNPNSIQMFGNNWVSILYPEGKEKEIIGLLERINEETNPGGEFRYRFVRDEVRALYEEDRKVTAVYTTFALIAILISSLGLFSLSVYDVQQRYREIALRKVHGATVGSVIRMLTSRYYRLLLAAFAVAVPVSWYAITKYVEHFVYKAPLSWWIFASTALFTAVISLLTLWGHTFRAATENPSKAMKRE